MDEGVSPSLNPDKKGHPTELFMHLQTCKEFSISPLEYFVDKEAEWKDYPSLKILIFAFRILIAEEETRQMDKIKDKNTSQD